MSGPLLEVAVMVVLTLKSLADASTLTMSVTTHPLDDGLPDTVYYPILERVGNLGARMDQSLPAAYSTSISISDKLGGIGFERKFSDLFERYTIVGQPVEVKVAIVEPGTLTSADFTTEWAGVASRGPSTRGEIVEIPIATQQIKNRTLTKIITRSEFPSAAQSVLGTALPIVLGQNVELKPLRVSADDSTTVDLAYATNLGTTYTVDGVQVYYVKDSEGVYRAISSPATTSTGLNAQATSNTAGLLLSYKRAYELNTESSAYIYKGGRISLQGNNGGGTPSGIVNIELCGADPVTNLPDDANILARASFDKATYTAQYPASSASQFWVEFTFDKFVIGEAGKKYFLTITGSNEADASSSTNPSTHSTTSLKRYQKVFEDDVAVWSDDGTRALRCELFGVTFTDSPSGGSANGDGLGHALVSLTQKAAATGQTNLSLDNLDLVFEVNGITDSSSGTVTGTNNLLIESPQHAIELLTKEWSGSTWTGGQYDATAYSATHSVVNTSTDARYRKIAGKTNGPTLARAIFEEICRNSLCRIAIQPSTSTPLGLWVWGSRSDAVTTITDESGLLVSTSQFGTETVVNDFEMHFDPKLTQQDFLTGSDQGQFKSYAKALRLNEDYNGECSDASAASEDVFGQRKNSTLTFNFLSDETSAYRVGLGNLQIYSRPHTMVEYQVPLREFRALNLLDIVEVVDPRLPSFFGTSPKAALPTYEDEPVDVLQGECFKRASLYRAIVESREIVLSDGAPRLSLGLRLLTSPHDPT